MSVRFLTAFVAVALCASPALAADPPAKKPDPAESVLDTLFGQEVTVGQENINDIPLFELLEKLSKRHALTFVINEEAFKAAGMPDVKERKPNLAATNVRGLQLHQFLALIGESMGTTYLVRKSVIEIVPVSYAAKVAKAQTEQGEDGAVRLVEPLVCAVFKEKPLNEAVALLAERYDLNVVVTPQAGDAKTGFVTARLLNMPADKALEMLAVQSDLRVVRKGNGYLITSRDHANEMFNEKLERTRQMIELENLRKAGPPKPEPQPQPEPKP